MKAAHFLGDLSLHVTSSIRAPGWPAFQARYDPDGRRLVVIPGGTLVPLVRPGVVFVRVPSDISVWGVSQELVSRSMIATRKEFEAEVSAWPPSERLYAPMTDKARRGWWVGEDHDHPFYLLADWDGDSRLQGSSLVAPSAADLKKYGRS